MTLSEDEIQIVRELIEDWGSDWPSLCSSRLRPLAEKLGMWEPESHPTPEELARREEFRNSPFSTMAAAMFKTANEHMVKSLLDRKADLAFIGGDASNNYQWPGVVIDDKDPRIGTTLCIRLPNDYSTKE